MRVYMWRSEGNLYLLSMVLGTEFKSGYAVNISIHLSHLASCPQNLMLNCRSKPPYLGR